MSLAALIWGCAPLGSSQGVDLEREETITFRGNDYVTTRRGVTINESDLIPIGTATLAHTAVVDPSVWALPEVDPETLVIVRTPPGFEEPGWNIGEFIYFTRRGQVGTVTEACAFYSDPTPGCPYVDPSPS